MTLTSLPNSGAALASLVDGYSRRFGKLWPLAWIAFGFVGYLGLIVFCCLFLRPFHVNNVELMLGAAALPVCLLLGPSSLLGGPVMIVVFVLLKILSW